MRTLARLVWGVDVDRALRPVLAVALVGGVATSMIFPFLGIWALERLGASQVELSIAFLGSAVAAGVAGFLGGRASDRVGRRRVILAGWTGLTLVPLGVLAVGDRVLPALVLMASFGVFGALGQAAELALVADLVAPDRHEEGYAALRVAQNLGVSFGPIIGGLLLFGSSWPHLFWGVFGFCALSSAVAFRLLPRGGRYVPVTPPRRSAFAVVRRDRLFLLFIGSAVLGAMTYVAYDALLPISLASSHGIAPSTWGFLVVVNPILVTTVQLRLTRRLAAISPSVKLAVAMPLMGVPFMLLALADGVVVVALLVVVFVIGEMLWAPTSQGVVAALAPADIRGAYMGVFGGSWQAAWALTPFFGLQVRHAFGDAVMWETVAVVSALAAVAGALAARGRGDARPVGVGAR